MSKSTKTSKKKGPTKKATKKKPQPKKTKAKTTAKKAPAKKKTAPKKKTSASKKTTKEAPVKKAATKKKRTKKSVSADDKAMLHELEVEIQSDDEQVSLGAIERLGVLNHPQATQALIGALSDSRYMIRIHAAAQLGERKDKKSIDALITSLHDDSIFVRQTVAGALENIGGTKAKKAVTQAEKEGLLLDELPEGRRLIEK